MKIGVNLWIWESPFRSDRHLGLFEKVQRMGAETVEFAFETDAVVDTRAVRQALQDLDLGCSALGLFGAAGDLSSEDRRVRRRGLGYARHCVGLCAEVGAAIFSGAALGVGGDQLLPETERRNRLQYAAESFRELGDHCAQRGVRFCLEVLNRYESNLINTASEARELVDLVDHPQVGIHLDCFHMNMEETIWAEAIRLAGDRLFHLHGSASDRGTPGLGHVHWEEVSSSLKEIGYDRFVVLESFNPNGRLAPLARFWRPFADSPDRLASDGLAFLKRALRGGS